MPSEWSAGSLLVVCRFIIRRHLCFCCCHDFIIYLWRSIKFKYYFKDTPFVPFILKFLLFLCCVKMDRWGGSLHFIYSNWPEDWSGVIGIGWPLGRKGWKHFKTFSLNLSNHKAKVYCWPATYYWILFFEPRQNGYQASVIKDRNQNLRVIGGSWLTRHKLCSQFCRTYSNNSN